MFLHVVPVSVLPVSPAANLPTPPAPAVTARGGGITSFLQRLQIRRRDCAFLHQRESPFMQAEELQSISMQLLLGVDRGVANSSGPRTR